MSIIKKESKAPAWGSVFSDFFDNDRFFNNADFFNKKECLPAVNVKENDNTFEVELAAPGLKKENFSIFIENDVLYISAEKKEEANEEKDNYTRREFNYSSFNRSFSLPKNIDSNSIQAKYKDGVLNLVLAKKERSKDQSKQIEIA